MRVFPPPMETAFEHGEEASDHRLVFPLLSFKYLFKVQKGMGETEPTGVLNTLTFKQKRKNNSKWTSSDKEMERDTGGGVGNSTQMGTRRQKAHLGLGDRPGHTGSIWGRAGRSEVLNN